jgi:hypothetical protein
MINRRYDDRASCPAWQSLKPLLPMEPRIHAPAIWKDGHENNRRYALNQLRELQPHPLRQCGRRRFLVHCAARHSLLQSDRSIRLGSLFLTLPTRVPTGQQIISSEG